MTENILGRPINGDLDSKSLRYERVVQWDEQALLDHIDAVFEADETVMAINWTQYTPYFNDGDPCEFRSYLNDDGFIAFDKVPTLWQYDEALDENDERIRTMDTYEMNQGRRWDSSVGDYVVDTTYQATPLLAAAKRLAENWGHFEEVTRVHFGEHSSVIATRDGFNVEFYEHD